MISVDDHLAQILAEIQPLGPVELSLAEAEGAVLAEDVTAAHPLPSFDNSAMDGFAVRSADVAGADGEHPVSLPVAAEIAAGDTGDYTVSAGTCARITTGARLPAGADAIVPVEWTDGGSPGPGGTPGADGTPGGGTPGGGTPGAEGGSAKVTIRRAPEPGHAIRCRGEDLREGGTVLSSGTRLGPPQLGLLAASGRGTATVRPGPRIAVFSTGNELAPPGTPVVPGRIWDSNSYMLAAAARQAGFTSWRREAVADDPAALVAAIEAQAAQADALITSGGVSMGGEHDVVKDVLSRAGSVHFGKVAMHPGSPQGFGMISGPAGPVPIFTLPGNPVSAYVSFRIFVVPALNAMQGMETPPPLLIPARLTGPLNSPAGRRSFLRGQLASGDDGPEVTPLSGQGSHQLASLARANAFIVVPEQVTDMAEGDIANVMSLP